MDANREMELAELRKEIKEAKEEKTKALTAGQVSLAEKVQDQINKLEDQKFFLMQQLGESQPPNFVHAWRNSKKLPKKSWTFLETHAYPSRPFIAMSHFISFEPLIVPVSNFCLDAVLLSTRQSCHDPLLTLTRSRMTTRRRTRRRRRSTRTWSAAR